MKPEIRVLGIDDAPFNKGNKEVLVIAAFFRGGQCLDGLLSTKVKVDGEDATAKLIEMINRSKFKKQLQAVFLDGIALGGFNVVDINCLSEKTSLPVIVVIRKFPNFERLEKTLKKLKMDKKYQLMLKAGQPRKTNHLFIQYAGLTLEKAANMVKVCATKSYLPEPLRVAHLIGAGMVTGESKGRA